MKVVIPKQKNIIEFPEQPALLETINDSGQYVYSITYTADPGLVATNNVIKTEIYLSNASYAKKEVVTTFKNTKNGKDATNNLLTSFARQKDAARSALKSFITKQNSDISAMMPINKLSELRAQPADLGKSVKPNVIVSTSTTTIKKKVFDIKKENAKPALVALNLNTKNSTSIGNKPVTKSGLVSNTATTKQLSDDFIKQSTEKLLYVNGVDPASLLKRTQNLPSVSKILAGTITPKPVFRNELVLENSSAAAVVSTLINQINVQDFDTLDDNEYIDVVVKENITKVNITETLTVSESDISGGSFYITIFLIDSSGRRLQHITQLINHKEQLNLYQIPTIPPVITASPIHRPGNISFFAKQIDKKANGINIYRKELIPDQIDIDSGYKFVGRLDIRHTESAKRITDSYAGNNNCTYRFVPIYGDNYQSGIFSSVVVQLSSQRLINTQQLSRPKHVSITCTVQTDGINIEIGSVPYGPIALKIYRKDLTIKQKDFTLVNNIVYPVNSTEARVVELLDQGVKKNRVYEYICKYVFREGDEVVCSQNAVVENVTTATNVVRTSIVNQNVIEKSDGSDVQFDIDYAPLLDNFELIRSLISNQGLTAEFQDEIYKDRSKLNKLFVSTVVRKNLTTGQEENFGIIDSLNFSDRKYGDVKNVKPPESGYEYEYTVTTYVRNPETLFPEARREIAAQPGRPGYSFSPWKWFQPLSLKTGNLINAIANQTNYAKPQAIQGEIADVQKTRVALPDVQPTIVQADVSKIRKDAALLRWQIKGLATKIDYFVIIKDKLGMREVTTSSHAITKDNYFELVLEDPAETDTAFSYVILPVFYDGTRGREYKTNLLLL